MNPENFHRVIASSFHRVPVTAVGPFSGGAPQLPPPSAPMAQL